MDEVSFPKKFQCTRQLLEEMSYNDLIQASSRRVRIFPYHISRCVVSGKSFALLDEIGEIAELAKLHDQIDMSRRFLAIYESDNMWMMEAFQDVDLRIEVLLQLLVELMQIDRFDGNKAGLLL